MIKKVFKRFCVPALVVLLVLSVYLAVNGARADRHMVNGAELEDNLFGCYEFDDCLYMHPCSSFIALKGFMPYIYGVGEDSLIIANTETGHIEQWPAQYAKTPVAEDELSSKADIIFDSSPFANLSQYTERLLRAVFTGETGRQYNLYQMDGEIWLVELNSSGRLWSIYKLRKTDKASLTGLVLPV